MPTYRSYRLDSLGSILERYEFSADDDQQALRVAEAHDPDGAHCEIWEGRRKVARLLAQPTMPRPS